MNRCESETKHRGCKMTRLWKYTFGMCRVNVVTGAGFIYDVFRVSFFYHNFLRRFCNMKPHNRIPVWSLFLVGIRMPCLLTRIDNEFLSGCLIITRTMFQGKRTTLSSPLAPIDFQWTFIATESAALNLRHRHYLFVNSDLHYERERRSVTKNCF